MSPSNRSTAISEDPIRRTNMMTVRINNLRNTVDGQPQDFPVMMPASLPSVAITGTSNGASTPSLSAIGTAPNSHGFVTCTVTRSFQELTEDGTAWTHTVICPAEEDGTWSLPLGDLSPGTYLLSAGTGDDTDCVKIEIQRDRGPKTILAISNTQALSTSIDVTGTVSNLRDSPVECTLTTADMSESSTKMVTVSESGNWMVGFVPSDLNQSSFSGSYSFEASAPHEGTVSETITL
jgi:hypothetical protein